MVGKPTTGTSKRISCFGLLTLTTTRGLPPAIRAARARASSVPSMASTATHARSAITTVWPMSMADMTYGLSVARHIAAMDIGQTVVIADRACVAVEAMEGTDEALARAARIAGGKPLVVVKVSKPKQDMRFDVPVVGLPTILQMRGAYATALAVDAGKTLLFDRRQLIAEANAAGIAIQAFAPATDAIAAALEPNALPKGMNSK